MSTAYKIPEDIELNKFHSFAQPIKVKNQEKEAEATFARLSLSIGNALKASDSSPKTASNPVSSSNEGPTNGQLQAALIQVVEDLASSQCLDAVNAGAIADLRGKIGTDLMLSREAQCKDQLEQIKVRAEQEAKSATSSLIARIFGWIATACGMLISLLTAQPGLFITLVTLTILTESPAMTKITQGLADLISKSLVADCGMKQEDADKVGKLLANIIVVVITIEATAGTAAIGTAALGESLATAAKAAFSVGTLTGCQAIAATNFWSDAIAVVCMRMAEGKTKDILQMVVSIILNLVTIVGGGAASIASTSQETSALAKVLIKNALPKVVQFIESQGWTLSSGLKALTALQLCGTLGQAGAQTAGAKYKFDLSNTIDVQGILQAFISLLDGLLGMNDKGISENSQDLASKMKSGAREIAELIRQLNESGDALDKALED